MSDDHHTAIIEAITKKLMDEGRIIEAGWQSFALMVLSPAAPEVQRIEMRKAFFAGSQHLFGSMLISTDDDDPDGDATADELRRMELIDKELGQFVEELRREVGRR